MISMRRWMKNELPQPNIELFVSVVVLVDLIDDIFGRVILYFVPTQFMSRERIDTMTSHQFGHRIIRSY